MAQIKLNATYGLTGALPAVSGANLTTLNATNISSGTLNAARYSGGITEADLWRLSSSFSGNEDPITGTYERDDTYGFGLLGTGMSQSSGVFTFPSTGYWRVNFNMNGYAMGSENKWIRGQIEYSSDTGSNYNLCAYGTSHALDSGVSYKYIYVAAEVLLDITNTTTQLIRFCSRSEDDNHTTIGDTNENQSYATFTKLAAT